MAAQYQKKEYVKGEGGIQAEQALQNQAGKKPGDYVSQYQSVLNDLRDQYANRGPFRYDVGSDALYRQYRDQYVSGGRQAMMDAMGRAAAMTGGYGSSYAQSVGQQVYQNYLQQLNARLPELYDLAARRYDQEGNAILEQYALYAGQEDRDYSRYRDNLQDYLTELGRLQDVYDSERAYDFGVYTDARDFDYQTWARAQEDAYRQQRDAIADEQWLKNYLYQQERDWIADEQWQMEFDEKVRQADLRAAPTVVYRTTSASSGTAAPAAPKAPTNSKELSDTLSQMRKDGATQNQINLVAGTFYQTYGKYA